MLKLLIPVIIVTLIGVFFLILARMTTKPYQASNPKMDALARDAAHLFSDMRVPYTMSQADEVDLLTESTKSQIDSWLVRYKKEINK